MEPQAPARERVGIALGGGGARGLAHVLMLEALEELGIKPYRIAGTSIGAVIGALYAAGLSSRDIRKAIGRLVVSEKETWLQALLKQDVSKWIEFIDPDLGRGGLIDTENFIRFLHNTIKHTRFEELKIPLKIVAADFWQREPVVFDSGPLLPAIKASMALPGLFTPVVHNGRALVDGGLVNPVPYDLLIPDCRITIAIDVRGTRVPNGKLRPTYFETTFNSIQIMQEAIVNEKLKHQPPDIYIKPELKDIRVLEFYKSDEIYRQAAPAKKELKRKLEKLLAG